MTPRLDSFMYGVYKWGARIFSSLAAILMLYTMLHETMTPKRLAIDFVFFIVACVWSYEMWTYEKRKKI